MNVRRELPVVGVVAAGGVAGALARDGLSVAWPAPPGGFPWATFAINVAGCLLIGVLIVLVTEVWAAHRLVRPFLGTGLLGGFTTFSTYAEQGRALLAGGHPVVACGYLVGTLVAALAAVQAGLAAARALTRRPGRGAR